MPEDHDVAPIRPGPESLCHDIVARRRILDGHAGDDTFNVTASGNDLVFRSNTSDDGSIILGNDITGTDSVVIHGDETGITIGAAAFESRLAIHDEDTVGHAMAMFHKHTNTSAVGPTTLFARTRGTEASETVVADNDVLGRILAVGYDGTDHERAAQILFEVDETTPGPAAMGGALTFSTTAAGATALTERMRLDNAGNVLVPGAIAGGTATTDDLDLYAHTQTPFDPADTGRIRTHDRVNFDETFTYNPATLFRIFEVNGTWTTTAAGGVGQPVVLMADRTIRYAQASVFAQPATNWDRTVFQPTAAITDLLSVYMSFYANTRYNPDIAAGTATASTIAGFVMIPQTVTRTVGGSAVVPNMTGFRAFNGAATGTGGSITTLRGLHVLNATGTITTFVGVDLDNMTGGTTNLSLRSAGASVQMRHAGPGIFGTNAAVTASTALEVRSTTGAFLLPRMTTTQRNALTAANGMVIYNTTTGVVEAREGGAWVNL